MKDEIKEILSYLKKKENTRRIKCITIEESKQLLNYITNLQQENERLNIKYKSQKDINQKLLSIDIKHKKINGELREENSKLEIALQNIQEDYDRRVKEINVLKENAIHNDKVVDKAKWNEMIYKSRCEKASDFIDNFDVFKEFSFPLMKRDVEQ